MALTGWYVCVNINIASDLKSLWGMHVTEVVLLKM